MDGSEPSTPPATTTPETSAERSSHALLAGPALVAGFGTTLAVWVVWWLTHLPTLAVPPHVATSFIVFAFAVSLGLWTRKSPTPLRTGLLGGAIAGVLNLLILGSLLSVQAEDTSQMAEYANRFRSGALGILVAYTALTMALGFGCGAVGRLARAGAAPNAPGVWLARFSVITVLSFFPLLLVGGAVTGTESGMAVPDAITSYGAFSALLPMSIMAEPRIFLEHTHRLLGTLVGLTAIAQFLYVLAAERRVRPKIYAGLLLLFVTVQGLLGAVRVDMNSGLLAGTHGVLAQLVLAFAVVTACRLSQLDRHPPERLRAETWAAANRGYGLAHAAAIILLVQLVLGALARHATGTSHAVWTHAGFSIIVVVMVIIAAGVMRTAEGATRPGRVMQRIGLAMIATVSLQFVLGFLALWQVGMGGEVRAIPLADDLPTAHEIDLLEAVFTTAHQTLGAALLAFAALSVFWTRRLRKFEAEPAPQA